MIFGMGAVLRKCLSGLILIWAMLWSVSAHAQTNIGHSGQYGDVWAQKSFLIEAARSGDASALYELGLFYRDGINSSQNLTVAKRYFHYASLKGHVEAKFALTELTPPPVKNTLRPAKNPNPELAKEKNEINNKNNQITATHTAFTMAHNLELKKACHLTAIVSPARPIIDKIIPVQVASVKEIPLAEPKASHNTTPTGMAFMGIPRLNLGWVYLAIPIIGLLIFTILGRRQSQKALPPDFDPSVYLALNPDLNVSTIDPVKHYLRYGISEGRRYKFIK